MHLIQDLIKTAINEDIGPGDITTENLVSPDLNGEGIIVAKEPLVIAGLEVAKQVFQYVDPETIFLPDCKDGEAMAKGDTVLRVEGKLAALLKSERTALNFLQHLSGIATHVRSYIEELKDQKVRLTDTRKTTPGLRVLEKYAVRVGGAHNHRMALYDGVLIKDNHIAACGGISKAVESIRNKISHLVKIEVEVSDIKQVKEALASRADVIMLDNMSLDQIKKAVKQINNKAMVEVSGSVQKKDLNPIADTGVDIISVGGLTHSARSVDLSMRIE
jgi:nicotinate-nucleotide pyrophosphorylase (carboxylating)